jgi:hypothetical protein
LLVTNILKGGTVLIAGTLNHSHLDPNFSTCGTEI